MLKHKPL